MHAAIEQLSLLDQTPRIAVVAAPLVIEGLRSIGCDICASTAFIAHLPQLAARVRPDLVLIHFDSRVGRDLLSAVRQLRSQSPALRIIAMLPFQSDAVGELEALGCDLVAVDCDPAHLRELLGLAGPSAAFRLTLREVTVLSHAGEGLTNRAIATRMGLAENTVKNYLRHVHQKLNVTSRSEAVMVAARAGYPVLSLR